MLSLLLQIYNLWIQQKNDIHHPNTDERYRNELKIVQFFKNINYSYILLLVHR